MACPSRTPRATCRACRTARASAGREAGGAGLVPHDFAPDGMPIADTQGNVQVLPHGNVFVGWGSEPFFSEFTKDGELLYHAGFAPWGESYRALRLPWSGRPDEGPTVSVGAGRGKKMTLYASWNGAHGGGAGRGRAGRG